MSTLTGVLDLFGKYVEPLASITDGYIQLQNRLKAVNDGLQTQAKLQDKVFAAANRSRSSYSDMVNTFASLQASASEAFGSNSETLVFSELMQKSFKLGGADSKTQSTGIDQLVKAMGTGKIDSGAFDSITANAPMMLQAIETFTGKSKAELRGMAAEGTLTAEILKNSMFAASDNINGKFSEMPMTFAEIWTVIKNTALQAFGGVIDGISSIINSGDFQSFLDAVIVGIYAAGSMLGWLVDNLEYIVPILEVIGGVLLVNIIAGIWSAAAAFMVANWTIICIVAAIVAVITAFGAMGVTVQDVFSFIGGAISVLIAWINNIPIVISNIGTWISKTIDDFVTKTVNKVIDGINKVISAINNIMGLDIKLLDDYQGSTSGMEYKEIKDYSDVYKEGSQKGSDVYTGMSEKITSFTNGFGLGSSGELPGISSEGLGTTNNPLTVQGIGSNGTLGVDMAEEDIQYLRDIAERDYINKFSTATMAPNIQVSFGDIHKEADADKVASRIQKILREQIATASEGVY